MSVVNRLNRGGATHQESKDRAGASGSAEKSADKSTDANEPNDELTHVLAARLQRMQKRRKLLAEDTRQVSYHGPITRPLVAQDPRTFKLNKAQRCVRIRRAFVDWQRTARNALCCMRMPMCVRRMRITLHPKEGTRDV